MPTFDTQIEGTPCRCEVLYYRPYIPAKVSGPPEDCYPAEASEFEFQILDMEGNLAPALEDKCTDEVMQRLQDEYEAMVTAHKHGYDY